MSQDATEKGSFVALPRSGGRQNCLGHHGGTRERGKKELFYFWIPYHVTNLSPMVMNSSHMEDTICHI